MADDYSRVERTMQRATNDGASNRNEIRSDLRGLKRFIFGSIIVAALIVLGYALIGSSGASDKRKEAVLSSSPRVYTARSGKVHLRKGDKAIVASTVAISLFTTECVFYTPRVNGRSVRGGKWCGEEVDLRWTKGSVSHLFEAKYAPVAISWHQE